MKKIILPLLLFSFLFIQAQEQEPVQNINAKLKLKYYPIINTPDSILTTNGNRIIGYTPKSYFNQSLTLEGNILKLTGSPDVDLSTVIGSGPGGGGAVTSVAGKTGAVVLTKNDVTGINLIDNTSDLNKPISLDTQNALDDKANINTLSPIPWIGFAAGTEAELDLLDFSTTTPIDGLTLLMPTDLSSDYVTDGMIEDFNMEIISGNILQFTAQYPSPMPEIVRTVVLPTGSGNGVSDHGALTGLSDDDHPQYLNQTRGDLRYLQSEIDGSVTNEIQTASQVAATPVNNNSDVQSILEDHETRIETLIAGGSDGNDFPTSITRSGDVLTLVIPNQTNPTYDFGAYLASKGYLTSEVDGSIANELQTLSISGSNLTLSNGGGTISIPSSGVTDHGALTGLADDDHIQYFNQTRGDARYLGIGATAVNSNLLNGVQLSQIVNPQLNYLVYDTRLVDTPTDLGERGVKFEFKTNGTGGLSDGSSGFYGVQTFQQWDAPAGGETHQLAFTGNKNLYLRNATIGDAWNSWAKIWHSENDGSGSGLDADLVRGQVPLFSIPDNSVTNAKIVSSTINLDRLSATGTRSSTTVLHGDNTWKPIVSGGTGDISGTGVNNELAVFTGNKTIANSGITVSAGGNDLFVPNTVVANGEVLVSEISGNIVSGNLTYSGTGWSTTQTAPIQINYSKVGKQVFIRGSLASPVSRTLNTTQGTGGIINIPGLPFAGNGETTILVGADNTGSTYNSTPIINGKVSGTTISIELYFSPPYSSGTISNPYILSFSGTYITN